MTGLVSRLVRRRTFVVKRDASAGLEHSPFNFVDRCEPLFERRRFEFSRR